MCGGKRVILDTPYSNGYYIEPTIIEGLHYTCRTNQEEIFGPVVTITPFDTEEEVIANGKQCGIWTFGHYMDRKHNPCTSFGTPFGKWYSMDKYMAESGFTHTIWRNESVWCRARGRLQSIGFF